MWEVSRIHSMKKKKKKIGWSNGRGRDDGRYKYKVK
jgi:hypothetical protein